MSDPPPRRSRRRAYKGLAQLQARAKAVAAEETDALLSAALDDDDQSFDEEQASDTGEDVIDSDFDDPEDVADPADVDDRAVRPTRPPRPKRRFGRYVDPATRKTARVRRERSTPSASDGDGMTDTLGDAQEDEHDDDEGGPSERPSDGSVAARRMTPARKSLRRSTKAASERAAESRLKRRADEAARRVRREERVAAKEEVHIPTQAELLEEARSTEIANAESLRELLRLEEEKKRVPGKRKRASGGVMSTRSRRGVSTISFSEGVDPSTVMFGAAAGSAAAREDSGCEKRVG